MRERRSTNPGSVRTFMSGASHGSCCATVEYSGPEAAKPRSNDIRRRMSRPPLPATLAAATCRFSR
eukprot:scaffold2162_cov398-Prasinococcus_capsulatus_cf.AAC.18